ncbi:hypothetical protein EV10_1814 [Prochlorococcus marinus str. SS51]|nr:hypothetical protein EV10_1814 [Prochlorococcus marinus str. SS51]
MLKVALAVSNLAFKVEVSIPHQLKMFVNKLIRTPLMMNPQKFLF